jgi:hypothetical protein
MKRIKSLYGISASLGCLACCATAHADLASTGIDLVPGQQDSNWTVSGPGVATGPAYLAANSPGGTTGFPFGNPYWVPDSPTSSWITYSYPLNNSEQPAGTYTYTCSFTLAQAETIAIQWATDNESVLYLNGMAIGSVGPGTSYDTFSTFAPFVYGIDLSAGTNVLSVVVQNDTPTGPNPTGLDLEVVPEPTTVMAGLLMLLPLGVGVARAFRKEKDFNA